MVAIKYIMGDVTEVIPHDRPAYIPHIVNDMGVWGAGFVLALSNKWSAPESDYRRHSDSLRLGEVIDSIAEPGRIYVANMVAQSGVGRGRFDSADAHGPYFKPRPPIRYAALAKCMRHVASLAGQAQAEIHAPRFGSGLAGGEWSAIESMILELWSDQGIPVTVYDFVPAPPWS